MDWLIVKNFGRVKYFNISYVIMIGVPVMATAYHSIESSWLKSYVTFTFPPTFKWMYSASILYALGIALYQWFCPSEIKRFDTEDEYVNAYQDLYERAYPDKKYNILLTQLTDQQRDTKERIQLLHNIVEDRSLSEAARTVAKNEYDTLANLVYPGCVQNYLIADFRKKAKSKYGAFLLSALFYISGTSILLYLICCRAIMVYKI